MQMRAHAIKCVPADYNVGMTAHNNSILVTIVIYRPDETWLKTTISSLAVALEVARHAGNISNASVVLVDNEAVTKESPHHAMLAREFATHPWLVFSALAGHGNIGYGAANNLAVASRPPHDFVLILNPDVAVDINAITSGVGYLQNHIKAVMVSPVAVNERSTPLYLAYRYPTVAALGLRGFAPKFVKRFFESVLAHYEYRSQGDPPFDGALENLTLVSGCFMLTRGATFRDVGGFDKKFFLYFEDFDLALRISRLGNMVRLPACRITHAGGGASRKGLRHIRLFCRSALRFFNKHGWRWF
jgi:GT2 family glycosyltransferase